jgi:hypothetical protein
LYLTHLAIEWLSRSPSDVETKSLHVDTSRYVVPELLRDEYINSSHQWYFVFFFFFLSLHH